MTFSYRECSQILVFLTVLTDTLPETLVDTLKGSTHLQTKKKKPLPLITGFSKPLWIWTWSTT